MSSSDKALTENIRLIPDSGFMRLNFGASELLENRNPPSDTGPMIAAISSTSNTGWVASRAILPEAMRKIPMDRSSMSTSRDKLKLMRISSIRVCARPPPNASSAPAPARVTATVLSSLERAISPFSRASFLRFSVGSSVLS
ncbi:hypothetical protein D3C77_637690 [compost metagenome]